MATDEQLLCDHVVSEVVAQIPRGFIEEVQERIRRAYNDEFAELVNKPTRLDEQRIFNLAQDRCFRIDWELYQAAQAYSLAATAKPISANNWHHTYVTVGSFGLTQSYVRTVGSLPQPAKFRENLAEAARCPRLPLDAAEEIYEFKDFYALFAHSPIGQSFSEDHQRLGSLMFCVPNTNMKSWAVEIPVPELIARYPAETKTKTKERSPTWKRRVDQESEAS